MQFPNALVRNIRDWE